MAFMAPITLMLCNKTGLNKLVAGVAINYGALGGANFMTSQSGIVFRGLIESVGYTEDAFLFATLIFVTSMLLPFFVITFLMVATHSHKVLGTHMFQRLQTRQLCRVSFSLQVLSSVRRQRQYRRFHLVEAYISARAEMKKNATVCSPILCSRQFPSV